MAVASWMLRNRSLRNTKALKNKPENKDDVVKLDFNLDPVSLMQEILQNICQKNGISSIKKLNYLNAFVHLISRNPDWKSSEVFGLSSDEILCCLRIALIQDSVQVRAVGLRALRYTVKTEDDVLNLNRFHFPYLISRSLDLLLKSDNERILMSERIQSLKVMRHILSIAPQHFSIILVRPLISIALRPIEETDRLLKACLALLCELCILNSDVFMKCDGVKALLRNAGTLPSSHMVEAICGALLYLLNKPFSRRSARIDLNYLISGYTNSTVVEKNSFREEERRLTWTNFVLLTMLKSCSGLFELCDYPHNMSGLKSIVQTLYLNNINIRKAILELLFDLINIPQPEWTDDENAALESIHFSRFQESFKLNEGFLVSEGKQILPSLSKNRVNLTEAHLSLLLICLLDAGLPDALVEVIVSSDPFVSLRACILLGEFLYLIHKFVPVDCYVSPPSLPNLLSYAIRGCPLQPYLVAYSEDAYPSSIELNKQYSPNYNYFPGSYRKNDESIEKLQSIDDSKSTDIRLSLPDFNAQDNVLPKSVNEHAAAAVVNDSSDKNPIENPVSYINASSINITPKEIGCPKITSNSCINLRLENEQNILNKNRVDYPSCKQRQRMALSAISVLTNLQKMLENPQIPVSLLLVNITHYGDQNHSSLADSSSRNTKKKLQKIPIKEIEDLIKDTNVLTTPEASRWKWESIRVLLKLCFSNSKILNDSNLKLLFKKLIIFFKPSSKKYSHTPLKYDHNYINIYTLVACELFDILLDEKNIDGMKLLCEFLEDIEHQLKLVAEAKSVHDCLLSPQRLANSLSQDYFLLLGRLSNSKTGLMLLEKFNVLQRLQYIAVNINLDCYVKLIVSCLSYVSSDITRKIFSSVLSCTYLSSRLYATKFLHVLLRTNASANENFRNWLIEMLVNQLYDDNRTISFVALSVLNEAVDNKNYLDILISLRPSLLHLGDAGLLLLIRFLSSEKGFTYLQAANFIAPQLQRWASSFNIKYTLIVEGELHDSMSQYQRGDDGRYRRRITGDKAVLRDVMVPPHLYGQLVQHSQGFNLLLKQENIHKMIQVILMANDETDEAVTELKSALWAMGHFSTSSAGAKYLSDCGVIKAIVRIAERVTVYSLKATAFYVLALIATTAEGVATLNKYGWKCLKRNRCDSYCVMDSPFSSFSLDNFYDDDSTETISSPLDFESPQNGEKTFSEEKNDTIFKFSHKFSYEKRSATLPERGGYLNQTQHFRSFSESKADTSDDWSSSGSPPLMQQYICDLRTDSSTSGISSSDSVHGKPANASEKILTLSPIPSSNSLTTLMCHTHQKENSRAFLPKRHSASVSFSCRLSSQSALGYKTLRMLQNRHHLSNAPPFSASATIEYLSADDRRQMSPLVRPKFPRNLRKFPTSESEIEEPPFQIDRTESIDFFTGTDHCHFSNSTEIDDDKSTISGPCYQGICLPERLRNFLRYNIDKSQNIASNKSSQTSKANDIKSTTESEIEQVKLENNERAIKRRRHDKSACLLCSTKENLIESENVARNRKTSTSSIHRIRTETESSYGGGVGPEIDSPIFSTWQQKPLGLVDNTSGLVSGGTLENDEARSMSVMMNDDSPLQSRSMLRKEVLKLVEQLGNPVLYKTCKQGLLQLKQICGDLFQDICIFSDVCVLLGSINYRIQARQLIQDLFLDAPFHELYEETASILHKTSCLPDSAIPKIVAPATLSSDLPALQSNPLKLLNTSNDLVENSREDQKNNPNNLEVIIETDSTSEVLKTNIKSAFVYEKAADLEAKRCYRSSPPNECCDATPRLSSPERDKLLVNERTKSLFDCRRAYSYPATNHVVTGFGFYDPNAQCAYSFKVPTTRSRSVSATCSYISEISVTRHQKFLKRMSDKTVNTSSVTDSISIDSRFNNLTSFSKRSLISLRNTSSSVLLALENPVDLLH